MSKEEITGTVIETVAEVLNVNASELNENTNPQQEFGADSIDFIRQYAGASLSGTVKIDGSTAYIDLRTEGFFNPHEASELAMRCFKSQYYRMQPNVRQ